MDPLLLLSATELARRIRQREITSAQVVDAHIAHIERVNPVLNAVVRSRFPAAREDARAADGRVATRRGSDPLPPFLGVPCTIKEAARLEGMPHSSGLLARRDVLATKDGTAAARLKAAGFIPMGVTNVSELCMWMESSNPVYGRTCNAYDSTRTCGGSSGGEGAIVGAGASPLGLGSDIGGSIRMPAFFNGVFGHKPTGGLVPGTGQYPEAHGPALRYLTHGPLARRAEDLMPFLRVVAGPDGEDTGCLDIPLGDPASVRLDELTVVHVAGNGVTPVSEDLRAAQRRCLYALARRGARVVEANLPALRHSLEIWSSMLSAAGGRTFRDFLMEGEPFRVMPHLARLATGRSSHSVPALGLAVLEQLPGLLSSRSAEMLQRGQALREELVSLLGPRGVLLYPPYPTVAPRHHMALVPPLRWIYTAILNVLEVPATAVPLGLDAAGLPLGVQVAAIHGNDHLTIAVAQALEQEFGGWVPPPRWS